MPSNVLEALCLFGWLYAAYLAHAVRFNARLARQWKSHYERVKAQFDELLLIAKEAIRQADELRTRSGPSVEAPSVTGLVAEGVLVEVPQNAE